MKVKAGYTREGVATIQKLAEDDKLLEVGRREVENVLIDWRDNRLSSVRNNGLVIREKDGKDSSVIRMGAEDAIRIGLRAIVSTLELWQLT